MNKELDKYYDISLNENDKTELVNNHSIESKKVTDKYELDNIEKTICWISGLTAGAMDFLLLTAPKKGGLLNEKIDSFMKNLVSDEKRTILEKENWVPYDPALNNHLGVDVENLTLNPRTHRFQSMGHDPILGFFYGVRDILKHSFTVFDKSGNLIQIARNGSPIETNIFSAIIRQFGHLKSDISTSAGLPIPFMPMLQSITSGNINGKSIGDVSRLMYAKGYNLNHLVAMSIPAITIELLVRTSYLVYNLSIGKSVSESMPFNNPKINKMLFNAYLISVGCNSVKLISQGGNLFAFNPTLWGGALKYGISEFKRYLTNEKENKRHNYLMELYNNEGNELDKLIDENIEYYTVENIINETPTKCINNKGFSA